MELFVWDAYDFRVSKGMSTGMGNVGRVDWGFVIVELDLAATCIVCLLEGLGKVL